MDTIFTTRGDVELHLLEKLEGIDESDRETVYWTEYRFKGESEIVRRDVHMELKESVFCGAEF